MCYARPNHLVRPALQVRPTLQVRPALPRGMTLVQSTPTPTSTTWRLGSLRSMGPLIRSLNRHNHHPKAILGVPEHGRCITQCGVGPATPINWRAGRNWPKEPTYNHPRSQPTSTPGVVIRSVQGERRHIPGLAMPRDFAPCTPLTSLAYKRHLLLARMNTQRTSISIFLFCSLRVGFV
jgi:hypothetical protein